MSRNLDDFKKKISELERIELDNPDLDDIRVILAKTTLVISEWYGHLENEIDEKFAKLEEINNA